MHDPAGSVQGLVNFSTEELFTVSTHVEVREVLWGGIPTTDTSAFVVAKDTEHRETPLAAGKGLRPACPS